MRARVNSPQRGVALIEVLVSVLIFSIGLLGMLGLQARAISLSVDSEDRNRAALLANEIATTMWVTRSVAVPAGSGSVWQARVEDMDKNGLPAGQVLVTPVPGVVNSADIVISWQAPSRPGSDRSLLRTRVVLPL